MTVSRLRPSLVVHTQATELLKLLMKYQPEDKKAKQLRLKEIAAAKEAGQEPAPSKAPKVRSIFGRGLEEVIPHTQKRGHFALGARGVGPKSKKLMKFVQ